MRYVDMLIKFYPTVNVLFYGKENIPDVKWLPMPTTLGNYRDISEILRSDFDA